MAYLPSRYNIVVLIVRHVKLYITLAFWTVCQIKLDIVQTCDVLFITVRLQLIKYVRAHCFCEMNSTTEMCRI